MSRLTFFLVLFVESFSLLPCILYAQKAKNPIMFTDVPDLSMIRVGDTYYMSSTTMHLNPGLPIMKSKDLVNWEYVGYRHDALADIDELNLKNGRNAYGAGSWASSLRYHNGTFYLTTFAQTTDKTYIYTTQDIENGPWKSIEFQPMLHDHTLFFDKDKIYMIWGGGTLYIAELLPDLSGIKAGTQRVLIQNASLPALSTGVQGGLPAEGSQMFKVDNKYYLFNISWPPGGMRTVIVHRSNDIYGPYEGRVLLQDRGVAQGGLIDRPNGDWYAYLFQDHGALGRIPFLVPVKWQQGWPTLGVDGKVPFELDLPQSKGLIPYVVNSDDFLRKKSDPDLQHVWQWNHNPDNSLWSVRERKGYLRLRTGDIVDNLLQARNTITQRTIGPKCTGITRLDVSKMKEGDFAGLSLLQRAYGQLGVTVRSGNRYLVFVDGADGVVNEQHVPILIRQKEIFLKVHCDFADKRDIAQFFYSLNGKDWKPIGHPLKMRYTIPHFMGYRFALFNYATMTSGGYVDFDYFHISH